MSSFGERLQAERKRQGINRLQLSKLANVPRSVIIRTEQDPDALPTLASALKLARALHVSLDYLSGTFDPGEDNR